MNQEEQEELWEQVNSAGNGIAGAAVLADIPYIEEQYARGHHALTQLTKLYCQNPRFPKGIELCFGRLNEAARQKQHVIAFNNNIELDGYLRRLLALIQNEDEE